MDTQHIPQPEADEIVRILFTEHPDLGALNLVKLAMAEGMPSSQAVQTVMKYGRGDRCVTHNAVKCPRCLGATSVALRW